MRRAFALAALSALAGCLGPRPDPSTFFLLTPTAQSDGTALEVPIGLGPVTLSGYLDRSEVATRLTENQIDYASTERWAEPLPESVDRVLRANLSRLLTARAIVDYPWFEDQVTYGIGVDVARFDADSARTVVTLDASWSITGPVSGSGADSTVAAMSRALARLAEQLASAVRGVHGR
jgi:uncharacterized lipoprotein YmbA